MEMDTINLVEDLKRKYQSANPFYICEKMGITIKYVPFINNPKGQFQEIRDHAIIFLSDELKESEERFYICAHELGHAIFHRGLSSYYVSTRISRSKSESEANCFAANLIVSLYKEDNDRYPRQVEELKKSYGLPESAYRFLV
ncbi:ImmA/IrrE family metallo-endopeptidase [Enterococcus durans]|uniref:ImmA/IrrE family metallo-endopeptidase n=1 Tax=Enterococcus durans TaxID=53345 RepID=UPI003BEF107A